MLEKNLERKCVSYAEYNGWIAIKVYKKGYPDRFFVRGLKYFFVEFKAVNGRLSIRQNYIIRKLKNKKINVYIINNYSIFKDIVDKYNE